MYRALNLVLIASCAALIGCVRIPGGIAPSNIPLEPNSYTVLGPVAHSSCKIDLFGIFPISGGNRIANALKGALRKRKNTDALINISVDRDSKWFILWSQTCTEVRGEAVTRS